ncbi:site-specific integrase [Eubacterium sp. 1001713B170207_170306_E7]|uniref:tyrosine-type recombinase/integrase n=1 Tax=Eubacterium sp. 1001713B170207_170306_E7 TaxID=2787097 RepID=UPI0018997906|nr:site-specific integrase [Eubacterium sp. 1001713B170207_170306_E7]
MKRTFSIWSESIRRFFSKRSVTLEAFSREWLRERRDEGKIKESTLTNYQRIIERYLLPSLGRYRLDAVTSEAVQNFVKNLEKKELKTSTIQGVAGRLSSIMEKAVEAGLIDKNPCDHIVIQKQQQTTTGKILTIEDQKELTNWLLAHEHNLSLAVQLGLFAGMRIGEIAALQWKDIDLKNGFIHIRRNVQRIKNPGTGQRKTITQIGTPKSQKAFRSIPVTSILMKSLRRYEKKGIKPEAFVIAKKNGAAYDVRTIQRYFKKIITALQLDNYRFHDLRHTFATRAKESGMDIQIISEILGHSETAVTMNIYLHITDLHKKQEMILLDKLNATIYGKAA